MPAAASNGFPCFKKLGGAQANQVFLVTNIFNCRKRFWRAVFPHFWGLFLNLESVGSNFALGSGFATFWLFIFGSFAVF